MNTPTVEEFAAEAAEWLAANATPKRHTSREVVWGEGEFSVAVFHNMTFEEERDYLNGMRAWIQKRAERGYHAIRWRPEVGGLGLSGAHARAYGKLEAQYESPGSHELVGVTTGLVAPTIDFFGTDEQKERFVSACLRTDIFVCQLFSEPGAGSDLAALGCKATPDGDEWVISGQKVWSSGAQFSEWGLLIARTDVDAPKHKGMTAFLVPMDAEGVDVRPIKQMSGGTSFNEVFFNDARIPDSLRLGPVGEGWKVALTTLGFERDHSSSGSGGGSSSGGNWQQLLATATALGRIDEPVVKAACIDYYVNSTIERLLNRRAADNARGGTPGPEASLGKIMWTENMRRLTDVISLVLGPRLVADSGEWGTYEWGEHVLGAPGYRIAGGSDEVQRNIVGERVLGLPGEPRVDKNTPWREIPK